ncbi:hypothetical protein [Noviherbaspirillum sp. Root189]|uniref:hypothetical protein n=1 Tax=Noviherbaspirillum sp. Root189 TaxID=1736487 RepID=UPI00190FEF0B|nr:hypothetical protein [Noviherbaspirillum sp. Root189]
MKNYPNITHMLKTVFNAEDGLSIDTAIRIYQRTAVSSGNLDALKCELKLAFSDQDLSWKEMLRNDDYEVFDAETENDAREHAKKILWAPLNT